MANNTENPEGNLSLIGHFLKESSHTREEWCMKCTLCSVKIKQTVSVYCRVSAALCAAVILEQHIQCSELDYVSALLVPFCH